MAAAVGYLCGLPPKVVIKKPRSEHTPFKYSFILSLLFAKTVFAVYLNTLNEVSKSATCTLVVSANRPWDISVDDHKVGHS